MTEGTQVKLLRRMTRPQGPEVPENPLTSSRAVRLALTRAANDTTGLVLTVRSVAQEVTGLDDMLSTLGEELMLVGLSRAGDLAGLIAFDMELRAAVLEMETMGAVLAQPSEKRPPTRTDMMLCEPLLAAFLSAFPAAVRGTPLEGWLDGILPGDRVNSARTAGLVLTDGAYRIVRMNVDLGVADRQGMLVMALPVVQEATPPEPAPPLSDAWDSMFQSAITDAPACLDALLHRFPVSLATAQSLRVGSVLPLPGCTVGSVRLLSPDGQVVAQARLGQVGGYRAVRLQAAPPPELSDLCDGTVEPVVALPDSIGMEVAETRPATQAYDFPAPLDGAVEAPNPDSLVDGMTDNAAPKQDPGPL